MKLFGAWIGFCGIIGLGVISVGVWAVIQIVQWVTAQ